jgi:uncharacterized protein (TIGR03000 family)
MTRCLLCAGLMFVLAGPGMALPWKKRQVIAEPEGIKVAIVVTVPTEKAQVWIDDKPTKQNGAVRVFYSPPLAPGSYVYRIVARWTEDGAKVTAERTLRFRPEKKQEFTIEFKADSILKPGP